MFSTPAPEPERSASNCVLAIDPGRSKCGVAIVRSDGAPLFRAVVPTEALSPELIRLDTVYKPARVAVGNGTGGGDVCRAIREALPAAELTMIDESHTSEEARKRYIKEVPARGVQKLLPKSLRTPPCAYDDYVAVILGERFWGIERG